MISPALIKILADIGVPIVKGMFTGDKARSEAEQKFREALLRLDEKQLELSSAALMVELQGTKLQRNWRPHLMYTLMALLIWLCAVVPIYNSLFIGFLGLFGFSPPRIDVPAVWRSVPKEFWSLLMLALGGYIGGRSVEKVAETVMQSPGGVRKKLTDLFPGGQEETPEEFARRNEDIRMTQTVDVDLVSEVHKSVKRKQVGFREDGEQ